MNLLSREERNKTFINSNGKNISISVFIVSLTLNFICIYKIKYAINESIYEYTNNNGLFKKIKENSKLIQKITNDDVKLIKENNNKIYYLDEDSFYMYTPNNGSEIIFYNYELSFNDENTIFVYLNN